MKLYVNMLLALCCLIVITGCKEKHHSTGPDLNLPVIETGAVSQISSGLPNINVTVISIGTSEITK